MRVRQQNASSQRLAEFLSTHDQIESVYYPGLKSHPDHEVAAKLMDGFGGVVSFTVKGGQARTSAFIDSLSLPFIAPSLGGVDSLVEQPAIISYYDYTPEQRRAQGGFSYSILNTIDRTCTQASLTTSFVLPSASRMMTTSSTTWHKLSIRLAKCLKAIRTTRPRYVPSKNKEDERDGKREAAGLYSLIS